jgi:hypothetical protein
MHGVFWITRKILRVPAPKVAADQALQIAIGEAVRRGHGPLGSPTTSERLHTWVIWLEPLMRPCRIVEVDNQTGQVIKYLAPPR